MLAPARPRPNIAHRYLTLSSPRAMFAAQLIGACCGVVLAPLCFWLFWSAFPIGVPGTLYFAP